MWLGASNWADPRRSTRWSGSRVSDAPIAFRISSPDRFCRMRRAILFSVGAASALRLPAAAAPLLPQQLPLRATVRLCADAAGKQLTVTVKRSSDGATAYAAAAPSVQMKAEEAAPAAGDVPVATTAPPAAESDGESAFSLLDVRVGKIVEAWAHPDSEKLWCEKIDVGEAEPRQIASGLRAYYPNAEMLVGRKVLVVCNLKEAKLAGFASNGMVLCAASPDRSTVAFVEPPESAAPGERVLEQGAALVEPASPNAVKKKKLMEKAAEGLRAVDTVATHAGKTLVVAGGPCKSPTVTSGTIN